MKLVAADAEYWPILNGEVFDKLFVLTESCLEKADIPPFEAPV